LSHTELKRESLPAALARKLPRYPIPVSLIAQLAVYLKAQGRGLGKITLIRALAYSLEINIHLPSYTIVVDALSDQVQAFYEQYGFNVLDHHCERVRPYIPIKTVEQLFL
jgi:GNAT superfamily N-acetyltransferase